MPLSRRRFIKQSTLAAAAGLTARRWMPRLAAADAPAAAPIISTANLPIASGPFEPTWESLSQYQSPDWFRDAKFGIWAHWGPQCQPEQGDWYARRMYTPTDTRGRPEPDFAYHRAHYGHQSKFGFKDVINTWKAERWDPEKLLGLYKRAGAKYFCCLACHHDNTDLWDSTYQSWNSTAVGPKKNLVGGWAQATRAAGLRFAVSVHASHAWSWYEVSQFSDRDGPLAGVPYDGKMTKDMGKGLWWDGLDPQELYAQSHTPGNGNVIWDWNAAQGSTIPDQAYCEKFFRRSADLIDKYHPDLIYFDDTVLPLYPISDVGLRIAAHYYNSNIAWNSTPRSRRVQFPRPHTEFLPSDGGLTAVLTGKVLNEQQRKCLVWDFERGTPPNMLPQHWQNDTCIGDWHYKRSIFDNHTYKTPETIARNLVDNVSKNGNLQLNIPLPGHGEPDSDELQFLADFTKWMDVNGDAIYASRPWKIFGEGPSASPNAGAPVRAQGFNEGRTRYSARDFRYFQKDGVLYAFAMAWPTDRQYLLTALADGSPYAPGKVERVDLLGMSEPLNFVRDSVGLHVTVPEQQVGNYVFGLKISGDGLTV